MSLTHRVFAACSRKARTGLGNECANVVARDWHRAMKDTRFEVNASINGVAVRLDVDPTDRLIDVLRSTLGLTGTKEGCSVGVCGLCAVLVDGELVSACLFPAVHMGGVSITTIEGLSSGGDLTPMQKAFIECGGFQCGICTSGQVVAATALLREVDNPTESQVREWMMGNLCRCTGYESIVRAIETASRASERAAE